MIETDDCVDRSGDCEQVRRVGFGLKSTRIDSSRRRPLAYTWFQLVRASNELDCSEWKRRRKGTRHGLVDAIGPQLVI